MKKRSKYHTAMIALSLSVFFNNTVSAEGGNGGIKAKGNNSQERGFQHGVNHAHIHRRGHGYGSTVSSVELDSLRQIGVDWIAIMPYAYQNGATANQVVGYPGSEGKSEFFERSDPTLTDDNIRQEIQNAHAKGIRVTIKPHIWSHDFWNGGKEWHGTIRQLTPEDHLLWWKSYRKFVLHYVRIAAETNTEQFCIGTELVSVSTKYPNEWRTLASEIRKTYKGTITYAAHWDTEFERIQFWDSVDYIGISAYFPLNVPDSSSVETLVEQWKPIRDRIEKLSKKYSRPVLFMEAGYRSMSGTFRNPWEEDGRIADVDAQARAYEALFRSFGDATWWHGVYFWKTFTDPSLSYEREIKYSFSFRGKPAQAILSKWYNAIKSR